MALSVLERAHQIRADSERPSLAKFTTTKMCREVIRLVAEQDDVKVFSNLPDEVEDRFSLEGFQLKSEPYRVRTKGFRVLAGPEKRGLKRSHEEAVSEEVPCGYVRTVDLRTIDMRLAARSYGSSLELFLADVRLVSAPRVLSDICEAFDSAPNSCGSDSCMQVVLWERAGEGSLLRCRKPSTRGPQSKSVLLEEQMYTPLPSE